MSSITLLRLPIEADALRTVFARRGWELSDAPHAFFRARGPDITAVFYRSGKLLLQGKAAHEVAEWLSSKGASAEQPAPKTRAVDDPTDHGAQHWIGIDEAGKGDFFGPLVICAAHVSRDDTGWLRALGVADSKALTDTRIRAIAEQMAPAVPHEVLALDPPTYNTLHARMGNLNRILAWAHAKTSQRLFETVGADLILSDQFAASDVVRQAYTSDAARAVWTQRTKAESDLAVACASIFARAQFLAGMEHLERTHNVRLHRGAGPPVLQAGRALVGKHGPQLLPAVAKLHFRTVEQLGLSTEALRTVRTLPPTGSTQSES
jgi:ribonuclease HIII